MISTRSVGLEVAAQHLGEVGARIGVLGGSGQVERGGGRVEVGTHVALVVVPKWSEIQWSRRL